jgi:hypothetical protein
MKEIVEAGFKAIALRRIDLQKTPHSLKSLKSMQMVLQTF